MAFFKPSQQEMQPNQKEIIDARKASALASLGKIFGVMFLGILLTAIGAVLWALALLSVGTDGDKLYSMMIGGLIAGFIVMLITSSVINWRAFKEGKRKFSLIIPYVLYALSLSFIFGTLGLFIPLEIFGLSFGVTLLVYGVLALFGILFKKSNLNPLIYIVSVFSVGLLILLLINLLMPTSGDGYSSLSWIITFGIFGIILLTTIFDVWQINRVVSSMPPNLNLTLYFAFRLYTDFINVLLRILYFIIIFSSRRR